MPAAIPGTGSTIFGSILIAIDQLGPSTTNELGVYKDIYFLAVKERLSVEVSIPWNGARESALPLGI